MAGLAAAEQGHDVTSAGLGPCAPSLAVLRPNLKSPCLLRKWGLVSATAALHTWAVAGLRMAGTFGWLLWCPGQGPTPQGPGVQKTEYCRTCGRNSEFYLERAARPR